MPQLSIETFISQYIWLLFVLWGFYWLVVTQILPSFSYLSKARSSYDISAKKSISHISSQKKALDLSILKLSSLSDKKNYNDNFSKVKSAWIKKLNK